MWASLFWVNHMPGVWDSLISHIIAGTWDGLISLCARRMLLNIYLSFFYTGSCLHGRECSVDLLYSYYFLMILIGFILFSAFIIIWRSKLYYSFGVMVSLVIPCVQR